MYECGWGSCIRLELNYHIQKSTKESANWLILVNGLFATLESYNDVVHQLGDEFHILRYDCRGQGKSPRPEGIYSLENHVTDLHDLVEELDIINFSMIGLSNGARIALEYSRRHPARVSGVVACDTYDKPSELLKLKLQSWLKAFEEGGAYHRFDVATPWIWGETVVNKRPELVAAYRERAEELEEKVLRGLVLGAMEGDIRLEDIQCPIYFIAGKEDVLTPPYLHEKMLSSCRESSYKHRLRIVAGGHASILEFPQTVKTEIVPFLRSL